MTPAGLGTRLLGRPSRRRGRSGSRKLTRIAFGETWALARDRRKARICKSTSTTPTTSTTATPTTSSTANQNTVDYNTFLQSARHRVAEPRSDEPDRPHPVSQPARFVLGPLAKASRRTPSSIRCSTTSALSQADAAIGRTVTSSDGSTSGIVSSVAIGSDGTVTATLQNGSTLALGSGTSVS